MRGRALLGARLTLAATLSVLPWGCVTFEGNRGVVPFFEVFRDEPAGPPPSHASPSSDVTPPGSSPPMPIQPPSGPETLLRPVFSYHRLGQEHYRLQVIWPLANFEHVPYQRRSWVMPFWYRHVRHEFEGGRNARWMVFPFLYGGRSDGEGGYFAFLPIAGKLRGLVGYDEIDFYAFPVFWRSRYHGRISTHLLFPFINWVSGDGGSGGRFLPFYGRYRAQTPDGRERYDKRFILWPFFFHQRNDLNTRYPSKLIFFFPFYGRNESARTLTRTYLWPIFHTTLDKRTGKKVYFGLAWPYRFGEGQFDLWPLYGVKREVEEDALGERGVRRRFRRFVLWFIHRYDRTEDDVRRSVRLWLLPVYWRFHDLEKSTGQEDLEWRVWPLVGYRRVNGRSALEFPSPLPIRQAKPMERFYARLWQLFLYRNNPEEKGWEALFAAVTYRNQKKEERRTFSVLGGLFETRSGPEGIRLRFFYLPWR